MTPQTYSTENRFIRRDRCAIILWLVLAVLLVASMVAIGGYTRLSGSGLSITQWKPVHGVVPPLNEAQWQEEFSGYRATPQFAKINSDMTLPEFKSIYWPEYIHRLLGRALGFLFLLPFMVFALRHSFTARFGWRLMGIFALGGLQGVIGWVMVASGLVDTPYVSPVRLALHLLTAFAIFAALLWALFDVIALWDTNLPKIPYSTKRWFEGWLALLATQLMLGAFMAGLHAGLIYNTWPTMNGQWIPGGLSDPHLRSMENLTFVQFAHRTVAVLVALGFLLWWYLQREYVKDAHLGKVCTGVAAAIALQFILGVATLLKGVPLPLALLHQLVALALFAVSVILLHGLFALKQPKQRPQH